MFLSFSSDEDTTCFMTPKSQNVAVRGDDADVVASMALASCRIHLYHLLFRELEKAGSSVANGWLKAITTLV